MSKQQIEEMAEIEKAAEWFENRVKTTPMQGARRMFELAADVLRKQIPKKPIDDLPPWAICPTCEGSIWLETVMEHIQCEETSYCEHCGQAIDRHRTEGE